LKQARRREGRREENHLEPPAGCPKDDRAPLPEKRENALHSVEDEKGLLVVKKEKTHGDHHSQRAA
jgi:hypothetical protein